MALAAALLVVFPVAAQDATPQVTTIPERPAEMDDVVLRISGVFPSADYGVLSSSVSTPAAIDPAVTHGANDYQVTATISYRYGPAGAQVITPYEVRLPIGRFPRFARIKVTVAFVTPLAQPAASWFTKSTYESYVYVKDPEPPRLSVDPPQPTTLDDVRVTMRFYHLGYYVAKTGHEIAGNVIRLHQDVRYVGPETSPNPLSEAAITHVVGGLPPGGYTLEWRQSGEGMQEQVVATLAFTVMPLGACGTCAVANETLPLERTSIAFDGFPLGTRAGAQSITLTAPTRLTFAGPTPALSLQRIWTSNADYVLAHDCPLAPATLQTTKSCTVNVDFNGTLRGESPGRLFVRFVDFDGRTQTASAALSGRSTLSRFRSLAPQPIRPDTAVEYYAPTLDHYFFTVSPQEQQLVDGGSMGAWQRTGITFPMGGPTDVCRFYGDRVGGPRSHFYTASTAECDALKSLDRATPAGSPAWRYEGIAMKSELPTGGDASRRPWCNDVFWRNPVYRMYNDGADRGVDSNHRFVATDALAREMLAKGWIYEGNALCD